MKTIPLTKGQVALVVDEDTSNRTRRHLGYFNDEEAAARAYDAAARELFGEFARPNFPETTR